MDAITRWLRFWASEGIRFLGFGKPHVPSLEERCFHAFVEGYRIGRLDASLDFNLPKDCFIAAIELEDDPE